MSESPLDALMSTVDATLTHNASVMTEADRVLSGSPYMAVVRANRADVEARTQAKQAARAARPAPSGRRAVQRLV